MQTRMVQINPQVYALMQSHISDHISFKATNEVNMQIQQDPNLMAMAQTNPQAMQVEINKMIAKRIVEITSQLQQMEAQAGMANQDPLVRLKQQEIDLRAMDLQRKANETMMKEQNEFARQEADLAFDVQKLRSQENAQEDRLEVAKDKLELAKMAQEFKQSQKGGK